MFHFMSTSNIIVKPNQKVIIESDSKIFDASFLPWDASGMIDSIRDMVAKCDCISFACIPREANRVTH